MVPSMCLFLCQLSFANQGKRSEVVIIMAVERDARLSRAGERPRKSSDKWLMERKVILKQLRKKMVKQIEQVNLMKELLEKDKEQVEEEERKCARRSKWNDLVSKGNSCIQSWIEITLETIDAEDEYDLVKLSQSGAVAEHLEDKVALLTGGQD